MSDYERLPYEIILKIYDFVVKDPSDLVDTLRIDFGRLLCGVPWGYNPKAKGTVFALQDLVNRRRAQTCIASVLTREMKRDKKGDYDWTRNGWSEYQELCTWRALVYFFDVLDLSWEWCYLDYKYTHNMSIFNHCCLGGTPEDAEREYVNSDLDITIHWRDHSLTFKESNLKLDDEAEPDPFDALKRIVSLPLSDSPLKDYV